jgi:hypothetical protein
MQSLLHQPMPPHFSTLRARLVLLVLLTVLPGFALVLAPQAQPSLHEPVLSG